MVLLAAFQGPPNPIYFATLVSQEHLEELGGMGEIALELMDHLSALCSIPWPIVASSHGFDGTLNCFSGVPNALSYVTLVSHEDLRELGGG